MIPRPKKRPQLQSDLRPSSISLLVWSFIHDSKIHQTTAPGSESRLRKSEQGDKWSFGLTAGKIGRRIRRDDEQTSTPEPHRGFQGEGSACCRQGRPNTGSTGGAVRRPPQSDHIVEGAA